MGKYVFVEMESFSYHSPNYELLRLIPGLE